MRRDDAVRSLVERTPDELADPAEGRGAILWPLLGTLLAGLAILLLGLLG